MPALGIGPRGWSRGTPENPWTKVDPEGLAVETVWDAANVAMGVASFVGNVAVGNVGGAALDAVGIIADSAATVIPCVPGGAGTAIKLLRGADKAADLLKAADKANDIRKTADKAGDAVKAADKATDGGRSVGQKTAKTTQEESASAANYRGGAHRDTKGPKGDGLESHHMPDRHADPAVHPDDGPAIQMDVADHAKTSSNPKRSGPGPAFDYRAKTAEMVKDGKYREAMAREIRDVRRAASEVSGNRTKYNKATKEMLNYAREGGQLPKKQN